MTLPFLHPWVLLLLPLAVLPWLPRADARGYSWAALLPRDPVAAALGLGLKVLATVAIAATVLGLAQAFRTPTPVEHVGRGAQIVVLLDRSRSMDQSFAGQGELGVNRESKGAAARRLLAEFARRREHDLMAMVAFSTMPVLVANFTEKQTIIQAAIAAGDVGHGLADTDIGQGLLAALKLFENQPYNGSRVVLLVSDGGARLEPAIAQRIAELMKRERVALYWLYLRASHTPGLDLRESAADTGGAGAPGAGEDVPERVLHRYFLSMGSPYHAYEAENPDALAQAIADVGRLQSLPIRYVVPAVRHDLSHLAYGTACGCVLLLLLASFLELRAWA